MKKTSLFLLVFAVLFAFFFLILIFFRTPFQAYPLMSMQDVIDLFTPLVLIPMYWMIFRLASDAKISPAEEILFLILSGVWVVGHSMHLAANSINNLAEALARNGEADITGTSVYELIYFIDETLSHYIWHGAIIGFVLFLVVREWRFPLEGKTSWIPVLIGALIYGFSSFCIIVEGGTTDFGFLFSILFSLFTLIFGLKRLKHQPVLAFFFISYLFAAVLLFVYSLSFSGFPQFSEVGLI